MSFLLCEGRCNALPKNTVFCIFVVVHNTCSESQGGVDGIHVFTIYKSQPYALISTQKCFMSSLKCAHLVERIKQVICAVDITELHLLFYELMSFVYKINAIILMCTGLLNYCVLNNKLSAICERILSSFFCNHHRSRVFPNLSSNKEHRHGCTILHVPPNRGELLLQ